MKIVRVNQRRVAAACAVVLVGLTIITAVRESDYFAKAKTTDMPMSQEAPESNVKHNEHKDGVSVDSKETQESAVKVPAHATKDVYSYTAQAGDSYTGFARQSVDRYAVEHKLALSADQRLVAEVELANNAQTPLLEIGQKVTIAPADVAALVKSGNKTADASKQEAAKADKTEKTDKVPAKIATGAVNAVAVAGDSYTTIARAAIAKQLSTSKKSMTAAQRVAAEAFVVEQLVASDELVIGTAVTIPADTLTKALQRAAALSADEQAAWQVYAAGVAL